MNDSDKTKLFTKEIEEFIDKAKKFSDGKNSAIKTDSFKFDIYENGTIKIKQFKEKDNDDEEIDGFGSNNKIIIARNGDIIQTNSGDIIVNNENKTSNHHHNKLVDLLSDDDDDENEEEEEEEDDEPIYYDCDDSPNLNSIYLHKEEEEDQL